MRIRCGLLFAGFQSRRDGIVSPWARAGSRPRRHDAAPPGLKAKAKAKSTPEAAEPSIQCRRPVPPQRRVAKRLQVPARPLSKSVLEMVRTIAFSADHPAVAVDQQLDGVARRAARNQPQARRSIAHLHAPHLVSCDQLAAGDGFDAVLAEL